MASLKDLFPAQLFTPRLILDRYDTSNAAHYACLLSALNSATAHARMGDFGVRTPAEFDALNATARLRDPRFRDGVADADAYYLIRTRDGAPDAWIGGTSLGQRVVSGGTVVLPADLGWALCEGHLGRGYATEAAAEYLRWAREDFKIERGIIVFPSETNKQSNRVAEKLGFVSGGTCKDLDQPGKMMGIWILPGMERVDELLKDGISLHL